MLKKTTAALTIAALVVVFALSASAQVAPRQKGPILKPRVPTQQPKVQIPKLPRVQLPQQQAKIPIELQLEGRQSLESLAERMPKEMPMMRTSPDLETAREAANNLRERFDIQGQFQTDPEDPHLSFIESGPWFLEINEKSGSLFAGDMSRLWTWTPEPGNQIRPMSEEETLKKARGLLGEVGIVEPPEHPWQPKVSYDMAEVQMAGEEGQGTGKTTEMRGPAQATFRPTHDGVPTVGPGGKVKVFFDENNDFAGLLMVARNMQPAGSQQLIGPQNAVQLMEAGAAMRELTLTRPERIVVNDIRVGYFMRSANFDQSFAPPVYIFEGIAFGREGEDRWKVPYYQWTPAVKQLPEPLTPEGEQFEPRPHTDIESPKDQDE